MNTKISKKIYSCPIDTLAETKEYIVAGTYEYGKEAKGEVLFIDKTTMDVVKSHPTGGTFSIMVKNNKVYSANIGTISMYSGNIRVSEVENCKTNTYISYGAYIYVGTLDGYVELYDEDLCFIRKKRISDNASIWVVKEIDRKIYVGTEDGTVSLYSMDLELKKTVGECRKGILDIFSYKESIYITSYDDSIEVYNRKTDILQKKVQNTGSIWKGIVYNNILYCSCIYDGFKVFDMDLKLLEHIPTETICYGLLVNKMKVMWASFYEKALYWKERIDIY